MSAKRNESVSDSILGQPQIHQHNKVITAVVINETMLNMILYFILFPLSCSTIYRIIEYFLQGLPPSVLTDAENREELPRRFHYVALLHKGYYHLR